MWNLLESRRNSKSETSWQTEEDPKEMPLAKDGLEVRPLVKVKKKSRKWGLLTNERKPKSKAS